jgi:hypothetical protein
MTLDCNKADSEVVKHEKKNLLFEYPERHQRDQYSFSKAMQAVFNLNDNIAKHLIESHQHICQNMERHIRKLGRIAQSV